jgi:hypothetical protein
MRLLVLGWKPGFEDLLPGLGLPYVVLVGREELREHGWPIAPGGEVARVNDLCDAARALPALARRGYGPGSLHAVHTDHEFAIIPAALLAHYYGAHGMPVATALLARDKWLQKRAVAAAGVAVPGHRLVPDEPRQRHHMLARASYPALLKPTSSASGRHTSLVRDDAEAARALAAVAADAVDTDAFILETIVAAPELHIDGVVCAGTIAVLSVGRYRRNVLAARYDAAVGSLLLDPRRHAALYARVRSFTERTLAALRLRDGAFHLEAFDTDDGLVFSECGARTGGSLIVALVRAKFGVDLRRAGLEVAVGRPPPAPTGLRDAEVGWTYLPAGLGRILHVPTAAQVRQQPGVRYAETAAGEEFPVQHGLVGVAQKAGLALVEAPTEAELEHRIDRLVKWFRSESRTDPAAMPPRDIAGYRATSDAVRFLTG